MYPLPSWRTQSFGFINIFIQIQKTIKYPTSTKRLNPKRIYKTE